MAANRPTPPAADTYAHQTDRARQYGERASEQADLIASAFDRGYAFYGNAWRPAETRAYLAQRATEKALGVRA